MVEEATGLDVAEALASANSAIRPIYMPKVEVCDKINTGYTARAD